MASEKYTDYRNRLLEKYRSYLDDHLGLDLARVDRWGRAYDSHFKGWLPADRSISILDAGCGDGRLLRFFVKRGYHRLIGVEICPEQVHVARRIHPDVVEEDILRYLNDKSEVFDMIVALDIIEHFEKDEALEFLSLCTKALRPGGRLIVQTPNAHSLFAAAMLYADFTHECCFSPAGVSRLFSFCGLSNIQCKEVLAKPHGIKSAVRWLIWRAIQFAIKAYVLIEKGTVDNNIFTSVFLASATKPATNTS